MRLRLSRLNVSLTKHGVCKIALLLRKYNKDAVLGKLWGKEPGINIDYPQACKTLSATGRNVPDLWNIARRLGPRAIDGLVLLAIIFSHHELIDVMSASQTGAFRGEVHRDQLSGKAYTNFAHSLKELGFSTFHSSESVAYDLAELYKISGLNEPAHDLFGLKLRAAGWDGTGGVVDQLVENHLYRALAITPDQLRRWLQPAGKRTGTIEKDREFFSGQDEIVDESLFAFRPGHNPRKIGVVPVTARGRQATALLLHNALQTLLYEKLVAQFGAACVGCEVPTGQGSYVDVVVSTDSFCWFYELKIADSARACVRQATAQLLEYAYWACKSGVADKLIVVGTSAMTPDTAKYLAFLRKKFGIPLHYEEIVEP